MWPGCAALATLLVGLCCDAAMALDGCLDDASCSFNGICKQQQCHCVSGWRGSACEQLDLKDAAGTGSHFTGATAGLNLLNPVQNWTSTWGGSVVKGRDGNYHMFAAMMVDHCGINAWLQNSVVLHAVSPSAIGAYTPKQIIAPVFSHEPIAVNAPTGEIVVFYTTTVQLHHTPTITSTCTDCTDGNSSMDCAPDWDARGRNWSVPLPTYMMYTNDPTAMGAWSRPVEIPSANLGIDPMVDTNFAPVILSNGSLVGVTRTGSITFASDWRQPSTYTCIVKDPKFQGFGEDPNMWQDTKGRFHILTHAHGGRHFFSSDARTWSSAPTGPSTKAYPLSANFTDGTVAPYGRRERPHLVFDGAAPVALTSAVTMPPTKSVGHPKQLNRWPDASFTFLQPIKT